jgi:3-oxoacyl-[acyl-carrier protein] reductase
MDLGIRGRRALIGGGSAGLGLAIARRLVDEGCAVALWARGAEALDRAAAELRERGGGTVAAIVADAADPACAEHLASRSQDLLGGVDILVLNTGGPPTTDPTATDPAEWGRAFQLLAITMIDLATRLLPAMRAAHWGRIVASMSYTLRQPVHTLSYSNAGRAALAAWMKTASRAVAGDGVTINGVLPGRFDTARIRQLDADLASRTGITAEAARAAQIESIPAGRYGDADELAAYVAFLCSEPARYQTGTFTAVDGGLLLGLP